MDYLNDNYLVFSLKSEKVSLRLNPEVCQRPLFVVHNGTLRQIKINYLETKVELIGDSKKYIVSLNVRMAGEQDNVNLKLYLGSTQTLFKMGTCGYLSTKFYQSVADYKEKKKVDIIISENEEDFCSRYYGKCKWSKDDWRDGYYAFRYKWNGIEPIRKKCVFPTNVICTPDGEVHFSEDVDNEFYVKHLMQKTYFDYDECKDDNEVEVLYLDDEDCGNAKWKPSKREQLNEWLKRQEMSIDELRDIIND